MRYSEITEIRVIPDSDSIKDRPRSASLTAEFSDRARPTKHRIGEYRIYRIQHRPTDHMTEQLFVVDESADEPVFLGTMRLIKSPAGPGSGTFVYSEVYFDPQLHGSGVAVRLYALAVKKLGYTIVSDDSQTRGSQRIWQKLASYPGILVYAWDPESGEYSAWDPADPDSVYYDWNRLEAIRKEITDIESSLRDQWMDGGMTDDEYHQQSQRLTKPLYAELESEERVKNMRLVATAQRGLGQ
jgi:hypothetical protein